MEPTFPNGMDVEVFKMKALEQALREVTLTSDKEHVTPYIYRNSTFYNQNMFVSSNFRNEKNFGHVRLTIDEQADYEVLRILIENLGVDSDWRSYTNYYLSHSEVRALNEHIDRNEGYIKSLNNDRKNNHEIWHFRQND